MGLDVTFKRLAACLVLGLVMTPACADSGGGGDDDDGGKGDCTSNDDCAGDKVCDNGECVLVEGGGGTGAGGSSGSGGSPAGECAATNAPCSVNGDCCSFQQGTGYCLEGTCSDACSASDDCVSGCCVPLEGGGASCAGQSACSDCMGLDFTGTCLDNVAVWCDAGIKMIDCAAFGATCGYNSSEGYYDCL